MNKVVTTHEGWFSPAGDVTFGPSVTDGWRVGEGARFVLCLYSSSPPDPRKYDAQVFNDELLVVLDPALVVDGAEVVLPAGAARYQQGSTVLGYVSRDVAGTLRFDTVSKKRVSGEVVLVAKAPEFDPEARGTIEARATFDVERL